MPGLFTLPRASSGGHGRTALRLVRIILGLSLPLLLLALCYATYGGSLWRLQQGAVAWNDPLPFPGLSQKDLKPEASLSEPQRDALRLSAEIAELAGTLRAHGPGTADATVPLPPEHSPALPPPRPVSPPPPPHQPPPRLLAPPPRPRVSVRRPPLDGSGGAPMLPQPHVGKTAPLPAASMVAVPEQPFSGVPAEEERKERNRLAAAVEAYRAGDLKKHKATMAAYRHALHKYNRARELRRRPYPPQPTFPAVRQPEMPVTHSLAAKCFEAEEPVRPKRQPTVMSKTAYNPGDEIVTWVRTVGAVTDEFWAALPEADLLEGLRYRTCAVVASAGILRNRRFGAQIDAHDAVIRFNSARTRGMEAYVGGKTTIRLMNRENFGFREGEGEIVLQHITTEAMMADFAAYRRLFPRVRLYAIHPAFYERVVTEDVEHPSNGYFGIRLALELCGCVRLYGFVRTWQGYLTYHYHDDYTPRKSQHSRDSTELPLIRSLLNEHLGRLAFAHPCILSERCEGCPDRAARCEAGVPYPVPAPGHCYGHGPPGGHPALEPWVPGKFWPREMAGGEQAARLARAREVNHPAMPAMNEQKPFLPFADERRSCFRACVLGDRCPGGAGGVCPPETAGRQPCLPWRDVSARLQGLR